jgi:hypothetical protein
MGKQTIDKSTIAAVFTSNHTTFLQKIIACQYRGKNTQAPGLLMASNLLISAVFDPCTGIKKRSAAEDDSCYPHQTILSKLQP